VGQRHRGEERRGSARNHDRSLMVESVHRRDRSAEAEAVCIVGHKKC
jgi:hypothetical protein